MARKRGDENGESRRRRTRGTTPPTQPPVARDDRFRPLLGRGEELVFSIDPSGGGGDGWHPQSFEQAHAVLAPQARLVGRQVRDLPARLRAPHVIVEAKLLPNYVAGSHFPERLLNYVNMYPVGSRQSVGTYVTQKRPPRENEPTRTYLLAGDDAAVARLVEVIAAGPSRAPKGVWKDIREFDVLQLPQVRTVIRAMPEDAEDGELVTWEAVLNAVGATEEERRRYAEEAEARFIAHVESLRGTVARAFIQRVDGLTFLPVALTTQDIEAAAAFNALRAIRPMPRIRDLELLVRSAAPVSVEPAREADTVPSPRAPLTTERIAVFDGGVDLRDPLLAPYVTVHTLTPEQHPRAQRHGTIVTNAVLYGYGAADLVGTHANQPAPVAHVDHYHVIPPPKALGDADTQFYWVLKQIERYVVEGKHRIVNLSLGPPRSVEEDAEPDAWTATLDDLANRHGVLFVCAAGNNGTRARSRVQAPADMANGLAVGACVGRAPLTTIRRARYSAVGPGRAGQRVAPLGVAFGGSLADGLPFRGRGPRGLLDEDEGTSFATPLVSHSIAQLCAMLPDARPDTLRAFAAHFAEGVAARGSDARHIGHGRLLEHYGDIWDCGPNRVTALYNLTVERGQLVAVPLPMPRGVRDDAEIRVVFTLCYSSAVQSRHPSDYTQAGLGITFRPHDRIYRASDASTRPPKSLGIFHLDRDAEVLAAYARTGSLKLSPHPVSKSGWQRSRWEGDQREAGKWETLVRADWRFAARDLRGPRLDLEYFAREGARLITANVPALPVTILATVEGPSDVFVYDLVEEQLPALSGIVEIDTQTRVPVRVRASGRSDDGAR